MLERAEVLHMYYGHTNATLFRMCTTITLQVWGMAYISNMQVFMLIDQIELETHH